MSHPKRITPPRRSRDLGFTMIEAIIAMTILGIVGAMIAVFIRMPVQGYDSASRRAELTDIADVALRRMSRDLQRAVPNSVRVTTVGSQTYLELLLASTGGVYRAECATAGCSGNLDFNSATGDDGFDVLGGLTVQPTVGQRVVIFNLGVPGADAYSADNTASITAVGTTSTSGTLSIVPTRFPFTSPNQSFQVIDTPVTYICSPATAGNNGTGTLMRVSGYDIAATQPVDFAGMNNITSAVLATRVGGCAITPPENMILPGHALVTVWLSLQSGGETVSLYHEAHINNVP